MKRRMTAVLLADVVGYSRLMSTDEDATHIMLAECFGGMIEPKITEHGGQLIRSSGDGLLVEFNSALDAVRCGTEIQQELRTRNAGVGTEQRFQMRIGVNAGDVIVDSRDIYGNSVNIAARLETLAEPVSYSLPIPFATSFWGIRTSPSRIEGVTGSRISTLRFKSFASRLPRTEKRFLHGSECNSPPANVSHFFEHLVRSSRPPYWRSWWPSRRSSACRSGAANTRNPFTLPLWSYHSAA